MAQKEYVSLSKLATFLDNLKTTFASLTHKHTIDDITDYTIDNTLSSTSTNPVQNKVVDAEFEAVNNSIYDMTERIVSQDNTISSIQSELLGKANTNHGTHVTFSTTAPLMDGTASVGSGSAVARSNHRHPTDTSRASKEEFDTHDSDTTKHITSTERTNWGDAYTHSQAAHAPSDAQPNQNAFSNIAVHGYNPFAANTTTDTLALVGNNLMITPDATNKKITFAVANGSTSTKGIVQLTNSTSSTSTTTAATPSSVKSAYDLANTAKTNAETAQTRADNAYTLAESKLGGSALGDYYTKSEIDNMELITIEDIDTICGATIQVASLSEVTF